MIPEHMKKLYRQYESMKAHHEEMKDIAKFKTSLGYPAPTPSLGNLNFVARDAEKGSIAGLS